MIYVVIATTRERRQRLEKCVAAVRESTIPHSIVIYENQDGGCVLATKKAIEGINGLIFLLNDDMVVEPDCLERLFETYKKAFPNRDGACQPWEQIHGGYLGVSPFCHTDTLRPFLEHYVHNFWDTEFTLTLMARKKFLPVLDARLLHEHFTQRMAPMDETYARTQSKYAEDERTFRARRAAGIFG